MYISVEDIIPERWHYHNYYVSHHSLLIIVLQHTITRVLESSGKEMEKGRKWDKKEVAGKKGVETEIPMSSALRISIRKKDDPEVS